MENRRQPSSQPSSAASALSNVKERKRLERTGLTALFLLILIAAVFWPVVHHDFVAWDDDINVSENPLLNPATTRSLATFWKAPYLRMYIPLTYTAWALVARFCQRRGAKPFALPSHPFHLANFLIHLLCGLAAFALLRRLLGAGLLKEDRDQSGLPLDLAAAFGALFFALHPLQVEPVAWVSGFRDVLSGLGALCALEEYLAFTSSRGGMAGLHYFAGTTAFLAALLSKPSAIMIPVMAAIMDYGLLKRSVKKMIWPLGFWLLLSALFGLLTQKSQGATHIRAMVPLWERPLIAMDTLAFYLYKLIFPLHLSPDYGRAPDVVIQKGWLFYTWLAPAVLTLAAWWSKERRVYWTGIGLFVAGVLPVLGFAPFLHQDLSTVADRYLYLSMIGPAVALAWMSARAWQSWGGGKWLWGASVVLLAILGIRSRLQAEVWSNTGTLFGHIVALNPDSGVAHLNLGNYLSSHEKLGEARFNFMETLRLRPGDGLAFDNLGNLSLKEGKLDEAAAWYAQALRNGVPDNVLMAHAGMGMVLSRQGKMDQAAEHYTQALQINPNRADIHHALAVLLGNQGKTDEALAHERWALQIRPDLRDIHKNIAMLLAQQGHMDEARRHFATGMGVSPDSVEATAALCDSLQVRNEFGKAAVCYKEIIGRAPSLAEAHNALGYVLDKQGHAAEAIEQYRETVRLKPGYAQAQFNLGNALLRAGKLDEAIAAMLAAVRAIPDAFDIRHNLGVALMQKGRKQEAIGQFEAVLKLKPDFEPSRQALAQLSRK